jgi:hypothetical protein
MSIRDILYNFLVNLIQTIMEVMSVNNRTRHKSSSEVYWLARETPTVENSTVVTTVEVVMEGNDTEENETDFQFIGTGLKLDAMVTNLTVNSSMTDQDATLELVTMIVTAFVLGVLILATVIGKSTAEYCISSQGQHHHHQQQHSFQSFLLEHKASIKRFHPCLSTSNVFTSFQVFPTFIVSFSTVLSTFSLGLLFSYPPTDPIQRLIFLV